MSEPVHVSNKKLVGGDSGVVGNMSSSITSLPYNIDEVVSYSIQAVYTGSPVGNIEIQGSNDGITYTLINTSAAVINGAGSYLINVEFPAYSWVQLLYLAGSGSGTMTATINTKRR